MAKTTGSRCSIPKEMAPSVGGHGYSRASSSDREQLAIDAQDRLYVADSCNHRIQVFDTEGKLLRSWGVRGTAAGERHPYDLAIGPDKSLYVCEYGNHRVQKFSLDGKRSASGNFRAGPAS